MHRPLDALQVVPRPAASGEVDAGEPEHSALRRLEIIPDGFAVMAEEFVAPDFHVHRPFMHGARGAAIRTNGPSTIVEMPRSFVTEENLLRIGRRALKVICPIVLAMDDFEFAGFRVDGVDHFRGAGSP